MNDLSLLRVNPRLERLSEAGFYFASRRSLHLRSVPVQKKIVIERLAAAHAMVWPQHLAYGRWFPLLRIRMRHFDLYERVSIVGASAVGFLSQDRPFHDVRLEFNTLLTRKRAP